MLYQEMGMYFILYTIRVNMPLLGKGGNLTNQGQCVSEQCNHENPISHPELKGNQHESEEKQAAGPGSLPLTIQLIFPNTRSKRYVWLCRQRLGISKNKLSKEKPFRPVTTFGMILIIGENENDWGGRYQSEKKKKKERRVVDYKALLFLIPGTAKHCSS